MKKRPSPMPEIPTDIKPEDFIGRFNMDIINFVMDNENVRVEHRDDKIVLTTKPRTKKK